MPRPIKCRKVCHFPDILEFRPSNKNGRRGEEDEKEVILLTVDEYETIRLIDKEGYSQEQCAGFMQIARTTVQRIYEIARKKVADAIIDGHPLRIEGGDFRICDGKSSKCGLGGCYKQEFYQKYATNKMTETVLYNLFCSFDYFLSKNLLFALLLISNQLASAIFLQFFYFRSNKLLRYFLCI